MAKAIVGGMANLIIRISMCGVRPTVLHILFNMFLGSFAIFGAAKTVVYNGKLDTEYYFHDDSQ